jgi:hypothetical protein
MPSTKTKKATSSKGKEVASSKAKGDACKGKGPATSKIDHDDDDFMSTTKAKMMMTSCLLPRPRKQLQPRAKELPSHSYP